MISQFDRRTLIGLLGAGLAGGALPRRSHAADSASSETPGIEQFAQSPLIDQIALSPDGKRIAMVTQTGDFKLLVHTDIMAPNPVSLPLGKAKIRNLLWGDNENVIVVSSETADVEQFRSRGEFSTATCINLKSATSKIFFKGVENYYPIVMGLRRIKTNGQYRVLAENYHLIDERGLALFSFGFDSTRGALIYEATTETNDFVTTPDGHPLAYSEYDGDLHRWKLYYNQSVPGKPASFKSIYSVTEPLNYPSLDGLGRDGKSLVIFISHGDARGEYHEISPEGAMGPPLDTSEKEYSRFPLYHPVTGRLTGFATRDDWISYAYEDALLKKLVESMPQMIGDDYRWTIADFADDPRRMLVYGESPTDAGSYFFVDFTNGDVQKLASNYGGLPAQWITQKTPITYKAADGLDIHAYLTLPPLRAPKDLPLVVLPHGGPQARDNIAYDWQAQVLASLGYAVLQPNFRGSSGYGRDFVEAGHGQFGRKMQTDLSDGVRHLAKQGTIDPKRVAIMGASYGGYAAAAGATLDPGIYRCAVAVAGVMDPASFVDYVGVKSGGFSSSVTYWKQFMGDPKTWDQISPVRQAANASCPILLIHGTDDTVVPIDQSRRMESALKKAGKTVEFVTYKGQDHWETVGSARIEMMKAAIAFLQTHNPA